MKVRQLIKELKKYNQDASVEIDIGEIYNEPILYVQSTMYNSRTTNGVVICPKRTKELCLKSVKR